MHPILLLVLVIAAMLTVSWVKRLPPAARQRAGFKAAMVAAAALLLFALVTGKLNPLFVALAAAIPILQRAMTAKALFDRFKSARGPSSGQASRVSTRFLDMTLDHDSGQMDGSVKEGPFAGRRLSELCLEELVSLHAECAAADAQSAAVLEAYLDRHHGAAWRERRGPATRAPTGSMTAREAREILGVSESTSRDDIVAAHRRLMQKMHPDRGGSHYLASKINQAKDVLLNDA